MIANRKFAAVGIVLGATLALVPVAQAQTQAPPATAPAGAARQAPTVETIFTLWDTDKNKALSLDEFKAGWQEVQISATLKKLNANFVLMDADKSGGLEAAEYANLDLVKKAGKGFQLTTAGLDRIQRITRAGSSPSGGPLSA